jgi:hypothetical protein
VEKAYIKTYKIKLMGCYPVLVLAGAQGDQRTEGTTSFIDNVEHFKLLAEYESDAYTTCQVNIFCEDDSILANGRAFCWAGDPECPSLEDGQFDLKRYQQYFKPALLRPRQA